AYAPPLELISSLTPSPRNTPANGSGSASGFCAIGSPIHAQSSTTSLIAKTIHPRPTVYQLAPQGDFNRAGTSAAHDARVGHHSSWSGILEKRRYPLPRSEEHTS